MKVGLDVPFKTINNHHVRGLILTADSLRSLRRNANSVFPYCEKSKAGYMHLLNFLEDCYDCYDQM